MFTEIKVVDVVPNGNFVSRTWVAKRAGDVYYTELARYDTFGKRTDTAGRKWGNPEDLGYNRVATFTDDESIVCVLQMLAIEYNAIRGCYEPSRTAAACGG